MRQVRDLTKTGARINSKVGKAIHDYCLITGGDKILVAVSGGKDSLTLLKFLSEIRQWAPVKFDLIAMHVRSDVQEDKNIVPFIESKCGDMGIEFRTKDIRVLDEKEKTSCFWCSWNRRRALFETAGELNCNKVALGHHKDDIVETILMNLLYNGEISAMNPRQELFKGKITIIRPLCYVEEKMIVGFAKEQDFPKFSCSCPFADRTRRKFIKDFIKECEKTTPRVNIRTNVFKSISRIKTEYLDLKDQEDA